MRLIRVLSVAALAMMISTSAFANFGRGSSDSSKKPASDEHATDETKDASTARQEADRWYHDAFDDVQKAKTEMAAGRDKNADKRLHRAIERAEKAIALDAKYHEAWNLVGYASRKLKDYDRAVGAYQRCLALKPDFAPAREYLGEAYLEMGQLEQAREQLARIDALAAPEEARTLQAAVDAWVKANPPAAPATSGSN